MAATLLGCRLCSYDGWWLQDLALALMFAVFALLGALALRQRRRNRRGEAAADEQERFTDENDNPS